MEFVLRKGEAKGAVVERGQLITITCRNEGQLADLVFLNYHQGITLDRLRRFILKSGDELFDNNEEAIIKVLTINSESNTNILYPGCRRKYYKEHFDEEKDGCRDLLAIALGILPHELPNTINLFMDFKLDCINYEFDTSLSRVKNGDSVSFYALKNCTIAVSACPCESDSCSTNGNIEVKIEHG
jgi:uncharacterized protein YcgI (DUF1989 family)